MLVRKRTESGATVWELREPPQPKSPGLTIQELFAAARLAAPKRHGNYGKRRTLPFKPRRRRKVLTRLGPILTPRQLAAIDALHQLESRP